MVVFFFAVLYASPMGRVPRNRLGPGVYHVLNRSIDQRWIFERPEDAEQFCRYMVRFQKAFKITIYHWAVMSNHFHLALETLDIEDLSAYVGKLCRRYSVYYHKKYGGSGPIWCRRYKSILVQKEGYLGRLGRYIERNPVRANVVEHPWVYPFSSAKAYIKWEPDGLVEPAEHPLWIDFNGSGPEMAKTYASYLVNHEEALADEDLFRSEERIIGEDGFKANGSKQKGRLTSRRRGRRRKRE